MFLSCFKATELIEKKLHVNLSFKEKLRLKMHKSMCSACRRYEKHSKIIDKALKKHNSSKLNINVEEFKVKIKNKISKL